MTRRSAAQAPARRPLDWSGLGGPERRFSAIEERRGGSSAQCRAGAGAGTPTGTGPRRGGAGLSGDRGAGAGWRPAAPASLRPWGSGSARGERGAWSGRPASGPPTVGNPPGALEPPPPSRGHPASGSPRAPGCRSLLGPRRPGAGEPGPPPDPAPCPGSPHLPPRDWGGATPPPLPRPSASVRDPSVRAPRPDTREWGAGPFSGGSWPPPRQASGAPLCRGTSGLQPAGAPRLRGSRPARAPPPRRGVPGAGPPGLPLGGGGPCPVEQRVGS